jgi:hypothetical protein
MLSSRNETLSLSNLLREEVRADPYPFYTQLRLQDPVHWDEEMGFWCLPVMQILPLSTMTIVSPGHRG